MNMHLSQIFLQLDIVMCYFQWPKCWYTFWTFVRTTSWWPNATTLSKVRPTALHCLCLRLAPLLSSLFLPSLILCLCHLWSVTSCSFPVNASHSDSTVWLSLSSFLCASAFLHLCHSLHLCISISSPRLIALSSFSKSFFAVVLLLLSSPILLFSFFDFHNLISMRGFPCLANGLENDQLKMQDFRLHSYEYLVHYIRGWNVEEVEAGFQV